MSEKLRTSEAAKALGLKPAMLRRHAAAYETVFGELESDALGRFYTQEFLDRLETALNAYHQQLAVSVQAALEALRDGNSLEVAPVIPSSNEALLFAMQELLNHTSKQQETINKLNDKVDTLTHAVATLQRQLEAPKDTSEVDKLQDQVKELELKLHKRRRTWWRWW